MIYNLPHKNSRLAPMPVLLLFVYIVACYLIACDKQGEAQMGQPGSDIPEASISAQAGINQISFQITIPPGHHAYLDSGKDENFIPIEFDWQSLIDAGILTQIPTIKQKPQGSLDAENQVRVIRGDAVYKFSTNTAGSLKGQKVKVRTQLCNDSSGICYRPSTQPVTIN